MTSTKIFTVNTQKKYSVINISIFDFCDTSDPWRVLTYSRSIVFTASKKHHETVYSEERSKLAEELKLKKKNKKETS